MGQTVIGIGWHLAKARSLLYGNRVKGLIYLAAATLMLWGGNPAEAGSAYTGGDQAQHQFEWSQFARSINNGGLFVAETEQEGDRYGLVIKAGGDTPREWWVDCLPRVINDRGTVAGKNSASGALTVVPPGGPDGVDVAIEGAAREINNSDIVAGVSIEVEAQPDLYRAAAWRPVDSSWETVWLASLGGRDSEARAINDQNKIVGWAEDDTETPRAVCWTLDGTVTALDTVPGRKSWANDINSTGLVVGSYESSPGVEVAFLWDPAHPGLQLLPDLWGIEAKAVAINDGGWIIGRSRDAGGRWHPFVLEPGGHPEPLPDADSTFVSDINNAGEIVGWDDSEGSFGLSYVWLPGVPYTVSAGPPRRVDLGQVVTLNGAVTNPPDGPEPLVYRWEQIPAPGRRTIGTPVSLSGLDTLAPVFTAPSTEVTLRFRLTVTAHSGFSYAASEEVLVTVQDPGDGPIHVSSTQGSDGNVGGPGTPVQTLERAIALASLRPGSVSPVVYVEAGVYQRATTLTITEPVRIFGGFQFDGVSTWTRDASEATRLIGPATAIVVDAPRPAFADGNSDSVVIEGFEIESADGADGDVTGGDGKSSICMEVTRGRLVARNNVFRPGKGGDAAHGVPGLPGGDGSDGQDAVRAAEWPTKLGRPGGGGASPGGHSGGDGGEGGGFDKLVSWADSVPRRDIGPGLRGNDGRPGTGQVEGGPGGEANYEQGGDWCAVEIVPVRSVTAVMEGRPGGALADMPTAANDGNSGSGGSAATPGEAGRQGWSGKGGSGGGGGGSFYRCSFENPLFNPWLNLCVYVGRGIPGGCGGGGGGGGEGGFGGEGGYAGGSSIGVLLGRGSSAESLADNCFYLNDGGRGGDGAEGGAGGVGGDPGRGAMPAVGFAALRAPGTDLVVPWFYEGARFLFDRHIRTGKGGDGQKGEAGGHGGHGGGGGGGNSFGVFVDKVGFADPRAIARNKFVVEGTSGGAGGKGEIAVYDGDPGEQASWEVMGEPPGERIDFVEFADRLGKFESVQERLPFGSDLALLEVVTQWDGGEVTTTVETPSGRTITPDAITRNAGQIVSTYRIHEHEAEYGDPAGEWIITHARADSPAGVSELVSTTVGSFHNRRPVAMARDLSLVAGADGLAAGLIDDGSFDLDTGDRIRIRQFPPGPFPVGATEVRLEVEDQFGFVSIQEATVTVRDETPPVVQVPEVVTLRAGADGLARADIPVSALDNADPNPLITINALESYPVGTTEVAVEVRDASGNLTQRMVKVVVMAEPTPRRLGSSGYTFEEGTLDPFVVDGGTWSVSGGRLLQQDPADWALVRLDVGPGETYSVGFQFTRNQGELVSLIYARSNQGVDYRVDFGSDFCRLTMPGAGQSWETRTFVADGPGLPLNPLGEVNHVTVGVSLRGVQVHLNDELIHDQPWLNDESLGDGMVALGTFNGTAEFDNVLTTSARELQPVVRLAFDDGTADDFSGNGNHGTLHGGPAIVDDVERGRVLSLDGVDDYVDLGTDSSLDLSGDGQATITAWVKMASSKIHHSIVTKGGWDEAYSLLIDGDRSDRLWTGNDTAILSGHPILVDTWTHVAVVIDGDLASFYVNGVLSGALDQDRGEPIDNDPLQPVEIGREDASTDGSGARWYFHGLLDDVRVFPSALREVEIQAVMGTSPPALAVTPTSLTPETAEGSDAESDRFEVWNPGGGTLAYTIEEDVSWLSCTPTSGASAGEADVIEVNFSTADLASGVYHGSIAVIPDGPAALIRFVAVTLTVGSTHLPAADTGHYLQSGFHNPSATAYHAGVGSSRNFFVFDLGQLPTAGRIVAATLELEVGAVTQGAFGGIDYTLYEVATPLAALLGGGSGLTGIYADLADGPAYSALIRIDPNDQGIIKSIPLLPQGVAAVKAATGGQIAIGGSASGLGGNFAFEGTDVTGARLVLEFGWPPPTVTETFLVGTEFTMRFTGEPGVIDWRVMGTKDLGDFDEDRTADSTISETSPGTYEAVVDLDLLQDRYFLRIQR